MLVITITYIPYFYGIDAIHGYTIYIGGSLINMFLVPLIGQAMEKKRTKWGRYKPYILFSLPLLALFTMMSMWAPQYDSEVDRIIYAYCSCVPVIAISTFANNMYQTMPNVITPNTQERADIMTPIGLIVGFAPTIMNIIVGPIRSAFMGQEYIAMRIIGAIAVVIGSICVMFILKVKERGGAGSRRPCRKRRGRCSGRDRGVGDLSRRGEGGGGGDRACGCREALLCREHEAALQE